MNKSILIVFAMGIFASSGVIASKKATEAPLDQPVLNDEAVLKKANSILETTFNVNHQEIEPWLKKVNPHYTKKGFQQVLKVQMPEKIASKSLVMTATKEAEPQMIAKGLQGDKKPIYTWIIASPLEIKLSNSSSKKELHVVCLAEVNRVNKATSPDLVVINYFDCGEGYAKQAVDGLKFEMENVKKKANEKYKLTQK
ncbi:MAG: DotI/IcmL/TraM family protein [Candidatus Berkiella sp.]